MQDQERVELHQAMVEIQAEADRRRQEDTIRWITSVHPAGWRRLLPRPPRRDLRRPRSP